MSASNLGQFCRIQSDSDPNKSYPIILWTDVIDGQLTPYLTCNCQSFCTGKNQKGKALHARKCKHTLEAKLLNAARWQQHLVQCGVPITPIAGDMADLMTRKSSDQTSAQSAGGLVRKAKRQG